MREQQSCPLKSSAICVRTKDSSKTPVEFTTQQLPAKCRDGDKRFPLDTNPKSSGMNRQYASDSCAHLVPVKFHDADNRFALEQLLNLRE